MRNVILHGRLRKQFGQSFRLEIATCGEAVRALGCQIKGFTDELKKGAYQIIRGDRRTGMRLGEEDVNTFNLGQADLHIVPVVAGSAGGGGKRGGGLKMILGVALVGIAIFASGGTLAAPLAGLSGSMWGTVAMVGLGMAVMGASQMLAKKEDAQEATKKEDSYSFSGPGNGSAQGNAVPLIYGRVMTGSVPASMGIDVEDIPIG